MRELFTDNTEHIKRFIERAEVLVASSQLDEAAHVYRLALADKPNDPECLLSLSCVLLRLKCYEESFHHVRHFLRLVNYIAFGYFLAGLATRELGHWQRSRSYLLRAVELDPSNVYAHVLCCMSGFTVCMDQAEAASTLCTYTEELDQLISETALETTAQIDNAVVGIGALTPFFLPYLGSDVKTLQVKYGAWICSVMAAKYPQFTQPLSLRSSKSRIKIGIVSHYFHEHSHWKIIMKGWLEQLDRKLFSIHCFYTGDICDGVSEYASSLSDYFMQSNDLEMVINTIHGLKLDVLIHSGIGMDTASMRLAALRLAPVQCDTWGHPVTTGMQTIDYFISSELMEPVDGDEHYSEKLIRLPNLSIYCTPYEVTAVNEMPFVIPGARHDDVNFLCCQNLFKYLPQYDCIFPKIALNAPHARFVFIECAVSEITQRFQVRLDLIFKNHGMTATNHVSFVPPLGAAAYKALNASADIYLDSIGWSGGNTTLESLPFNVPIVTFPGAFMRGRHTYAILKMMGVEDTIATSVDDYVSIAVRLANDRQWREDVSARVLRNKHRVYKDRECIEGLEKFLMDVSGR